jgi:hypothetical protein
MKNQQKNSTRSSSWKRWGIVTLCLGLIVARYYYPTFQLDSTTVWLVTIASIAALLPDLSSLVPYVKRLKIGDAEVELKEEIAKLGSEVEKAQISEAGKPPKTTAKKPRKKKTSANTQAIIQEALANPRGTLLVLSGAIEQELRNKLIEAGVPVERALGLRTLSRLAVENEILPRDSAAALDDFSVVRNKVAHGEAFDVEESALYSLISIGANLLQLIRAS